MERIPLFDLVKVSRLLENLNQNDIRVSLSGDELSVKYSKGKVPDQKLLGEVKANKDLLKAYFNYLKEVAEQPAEMESIASRVKIAAEGGGYYYPVTPIETYWVKDDVDKEFKEIDAVHGSVYMTYEIRGADFDVNVFRKVIAYLVERHESLRTTFHRVHNTYALKVNDANSVNNILEWADFGKAYSDANYQEIESFIDFKGHKFNFQEGPLFLARLAQLNDQVVILSMKISHAIFDSYSEEVFMRDMITAYVSLSENTQPQLPQLKYQQKEYLSMINHYAQKDFDRHRPYWEELYYAPQPQLIFPGAKKIVRKPVERVLRTANFIFPKALLDRFCHLSEEFSVSLFIVLQTAFNLYVHQQTGKKNIILGTYISGRDLPGIENQIGCYAKTGLIRTVVEDNDSFADVIEKVKAANEEMKRHTAFTLYHPCMLEDVLDKQKSCFQSNAASYTPFWNISILFEDVGVAVDTASEPTISIERINQKTNSHVAHDMLIKFSCLKTSLEIYAVYDGSLYDAETMQAIMSGYVEFAQLITQNIATAA